MAKIFVDANILIDLVEKRRNRNIDELNKHDIYISPLSFHVAMYVTKRKIPYPTLTGMSKLFLLVAFDYSILYKALDGPTDDFEDNVQLHSAAEAGCDLFLTEDKKLLNLKFFGKARVASSLKDK